MSAKKLEQKKRKNRERTTSNVFAMLDDSQIQEFKEAFHLIDTDKDGFISKNDLADIFTQLGKPITDKELTMMINEAGIAAESGKINFTMFLTMFGAKMNGMDPEEVIKSAFSCFDETASGHLSEDYFKELLMSMGDRFSEAEADELLRDMIVKDGFFNYNELIKEFKHGKKDA